MPDRNECSEKKNKTEEENNKRKEKIILEHLVRKGHSAIWSKPCKVLGGRLPRQKEQQGQRP